MMENNTVIRARKIEKEYGGSSALSNFNLDVHSGQIIGLIGPNGAGKSTFLQAVLGLVDVNGELEVLGLEPSKKRHELLNKVYETYYLVNIVDNNFVDGDLLKNILGS